MDPHHRMAVLLVPQRQMGKGAERTIAHEDVAALSDGMHLAHMGHVVRVARRGHNLEQEACARMKQGKEMPDRKPSPRLLPWRIAAGGVQLRGIGHGKTGPIDQEGPVAVPAAFLLGHLIQGATDPSQHLLPDRQRKPAAQGHSVFVKALRDRFPEAIKGCVRGGALLARHPPREPQPSPKAEPDDNTSTSAH